MHNNRKRLRISDEEDGLGLTKRGHHIMDSNFNPTSDLVEVGVSQPHR